MLWPRCLSHFTLFIDCSCGIFSIAVLIILQSLFSVFILSYLTFLQPGVPWLSTPTGFNIWSRFLLLFTHTSVFLDISSTVLRSWCHVPVTATYCHKMVSLIFFIFTFLIPSHTNTFYAIKLKFPKPAATPLS